MAMEFYHLAKEEIIAFNKQIVSLGLDPGDIFQLRDEATLDYIIYRHNSAKTLEEKAAELLFGTSRTF